MGAIFITGTGTDIGKTYLTCQLIRYLRAQGRAVDALKPVITGFDSNEPDASDTVRLLHALGRAVTSDEVARMSPWRFAAPLSPDLAARLEGRACDFAALVEYCKAQSNQRGTLLIEGIGGIMVPLDTRHTVLDWMVGLAVPVLLMAGSYLGSISHTLTCLDVLQRRALTVRAVIVNETPGSTVTVMETIKSVSQFCQPIPVISLNRNDTNQGVSEIAALLY